MTLDQSDVQAQTKRDEEMNDSPFRVKYFAALFGCWKKLSLLASFAKSVPIENGNRSGDGGNKDSNETFE